MSTIARSRVVHPAALSPQERAALLDTLYDIQCEVFDGVTREEMRTYVIDSPARRTDIEVYEGDRGHAFYTILSGSACVTIGHDDPVLVDQMPEGDVFGGMAVLTGEPRSASVRAATRLLLLEVGDEALHAVLAQHPAAATALWRNIARDRLDALLLRLDRFADWTRADRFGWFDAGAPVEEAEGLGEGMRAGVWFVAHGDAEVTLGEDWAAVTAPALVPAGTARLMDGARAWWLPAR